MRLVYEMDYAGEFCVTTADVEFNGGTDYSAAAFAACQTLWATLATPLSEDLHLRVMRLDSVAQTAAVSGAGTNPGLPGNCALRVLKTTLTRPGSMNFPGILEEHVDQGGLIPAPTQEAFQVIATGAFNAMETAGLTMQVTTGPGLSRGVTGFDISARIGTFRNRMYGR